jgi:hypothetical protein
VGLYTIDLGGGNVDCARGALAASAAATSRALHVRLAPRRYLDPEQLARLAATSPIRTRAALRRR